MQKIILCLITVTLMLLGYTNRITAQNIAIYDDTLAYVQDTSAILDLNTTKKGFLLPRLTTIQQTALPNPGTGLMIFNKDRSLYMGNIGSASTPNWIPIGGLGVSSFRLQTGSSGTDFTINNVGDSVYTFNIPSASATNRGLITISTQTISGVKTFTDTIKATGGLRLSGLSSGSGTDSLLTINASGDIRKRSITDFINSTPESTLSFAEAFNFEDFAFDEYSGAAGPSIGGKNDNQYSFSPVINSGSTNGISNVDGTSALYTSYGAGNDYAGIHRLSTGTTSTGRVALGSADFANRLKVGGNVVLYETRVRFSALPVTGQLYNAYLGMSDLSATSTTAVSAGSTITNGVYFLLTSSGLQGVCRASSTSSTTSTTTITANTWYKLKAIVNSSSSVDFYVNGVQIGSTVTTNIPTSAVKFTFLLEKTSGTTAVNCDIDYIGWKMIR